MSAPAAPATGPVATLFPGYFALVMATGIIAVAAEQQDVHWLAVGLYAVACVAYVVLWVLHLLRIVRHPRRWFADATDHVDRKSVV